MNVLWDVSCLDPLLMVFFSKFPLPLLLGGHHETVFASDDVLIMIDGWDIVQHQGDVEVEESDGMLRWNNIVVIGVLS